MAATRPPVVALLAALVALAGACRSSVTSPDDPAGVGGLGDSSGTTAKERVGTEVRGTVAGLSGGCPDLAFTLDGTLVRTNAKTTFAGGGCGDVHNGVKAVAAGVIQPDGSLQAKGVKLGEPPRPDPKPGEPALSGPIAGLGGACPSIVFTIGGKKVVTNGSTSFEGKPCTDLREGTPVKVTGTRTDAGLLATHVIAKPR